MTSRSQELVHHFLEESARLHPDACALIHDKVRATYGEINASANRVAEWLIETGVRKGDRVVFLFENSLEYVISYYGILKTGAVAVSLNIGLKAEGISPIVKELEPKVILSSAKAEKNLREADIEAGGVEVLLMKDKKIGWRSGSVTVCAWEDIVARGRTANIHVPIEPSELASIVYTSGSTGQPKGVMLSHLNLAENTQSICRYLCLTHQDIQMVVLPLFYVMGTSLLNTHFAVGGRVVLNNQFAFPATVIKQMIDERVTGFSGVPSTYAYLLHRSPLEESRRKLASLRYCSQAGGHMSRQVKQELRRVLPEHTEIYIMYGATEASARLTCLDPSRFQEKIDSIGKAIPGVVVKVLDKNGNEAAPGQEGELVGSGANIMQGYYLDPAATAKVLDHNGYHTGDLGYRDEEGFLYLLGRMDNLVKVGGHRINPQEIEDMIMGTGLVLETVVIAVADRFLGNKLFALVVPIDGHTTAEHIWECCTAKSARNKLPNRIFLVKNLPKHPSGKIDRKKCSELPVQEAPSGACPNAYTHQGRMKAD